MLFRSLDTLKWVQSLTDTLAQWEEHHMQSQKVAGSIPASVTFPKSTKVRFIIVIGGEERCMVNWVVK